MAAADRGGDLDDLAALGRRRGAGLNEPMRYAPVQGEYKRPAGRVPWATHERAWQQYAALGHGSQSAERIAERAGFGYDELACLLSGHNPWNGDEWPHDHPDIPDWEALPGQSL